MNSLDRLKLMAAEAAVAEIKDGMVVGLGTGSTADFALQSLARRVTHGLKISCVPTSERTAARARALGLDFGDLASFPAIDLTIDGADEIEIGTLNLIKGLGGALLREKIVASASDRVIIIADDSKLADRLGRYRPIPVEILPFGHSLQIRRLAALGCVPHLRLDATGAPFVTDSGNYILDCRFGAIREAADLQTEIARLPGVIEIGLFLGLAHEAVIASTKGITWLKR